MKYNKLYFNSAASMLLCLLLSAASTDSTTAADDLSYKAILSYTLPEFRDDGEPFLVYDLSHFNIEYKREEDQDQDPVIVKITPPQDELFVGGLPPGGYTFRMQIVDKYGVHSPFTEPVSERAGGRPGAGTLQSILLECVQGCIINNTQ